MSRRALQDAARPSAEPAGEDAAVTRTTRILHWASALLVASAFGLAWTFTALGPSAVAARLVPIHRSVGLSILLLTAIRVSWRVGVPLPPLPRNSPLWERWLAGTVQAALYAGLLAMPIVGWFGSGADGDGVRLLGLVPLPALAAPDEALAELAFRVHAAIGYAVLALVGLHVAGALRHHLLHRDGVLARMSGFRRRGPPPDLTRASTDIER